VRLDEWRPEGREREPEVKMAAALIHRGFGKAKAHGGAAGKAVSIADEVVGHEKIEHAGGRLEEKGVEKAEHELPHAAGVVVREAVPILDKVANAQ
jgi:hypothetical protein